MTSHERVVRKVKKFLAVWLKPEVYHEVLVEVNEEVDAAIRAERDACAKVAERNGDCGIARLIRERRMA